MTTTALSASFQVGQTVSCRSLCDYDCVWTFKVTHRTAKFVTLVESSGETHRVGIKVWDGDEYALPFGSYSMAPMVRASSAS